MGRFIVTLFRTRSSSPMQSHGTGSRLNAAHNGIKSQAWTLLAALVAAAALPAVASAQNADGTWSQTITGTYNWSGTANWSGGTVANGANQTANFTTSGLTGDMTVNVDTNRTIGAMVFDNPSNTFN